MSCSTKDQKLNIDLEDILLHNKEDLSIVQQNITIYKSMVCDIYDWVKQDLDIDYKKMFPLFFRKINKKYKVYCKKNLLIYAYRKMLENNEIENNLSMWSILQKCPARNMSGVTVITVLTSPYPDGQTFSCKHNCYYCPDEPGQPRSYLMKEPAVSRANRNKFDPILQMNDRIHSLIINGHEIDKLEIIIEGGTVTEYPEHYLEDFICKLIYSANTYFDYEPKRVMYNIESEVKLNMTTKVRIIGICVETRPDALYDDNGVSWLPRFRKWGITRVQLGVQHTDNTILKKVNRGHTFEDACEAVKYLKDNCFKVDIHLMPDLPFSNPEKDKEMIDTVFNSSIICPDQAKIYPCEVVPWTVIKKWYETGKYTPYAQTNERALLDVVKYAMEICPPYVRLPRVIRDIPLTYIEAGNMYPNLRQMLMDELDKEGKTSMDIRARECGRNTKYKIEDAIYVTRKYEANDGIDYFISLESKDYKCLFGFIRLRIPGENSKCEFMSLQNMGLIRELHVYGNLIPVGFQKALDSQHKGVGRKLLKIAENIACSYNMDGTAVISGIGVMDYYKKNGYHYDETFMIKYLNFNDKLIYKLTTYNKLTIGIAIYIVTILLFSLIY